MVAVADKLASFMTEDDIQESGNFPPRDPFVGAVVDSYEWPDEPTWTKGWNIEVRPTVDKDGKPVMDKRTGEQKQTRTLILKVESKTSAIESPDGIATIFHRMNSGLVYSTFLKMVTEALKAVRGDESYKFSNPDDLTGVDLVFGEVDKEKFVSKNPQTGEVFKPSRHPVMVLGTPPEDWAETMVPEDLLRLKAEGMEKGKQRAAQRAERRAGAPSDRNAIDIPVNGGTMTVSVELGEYEDAVLSALDGWRKGDFATIRKHEALADVPEEIVEGIFRYTVPKQLEAQGKLSLVDNTYRRA